MDNRYLTLLVPLLVAAFFPTYSNCLKTDQLVVRDDLIFTYVYGSEDAKMNHSTAEAYCQDLANTMNVTKPVTVESHLASIHDATMVKMIMDFVLRKEQTQFFLGGYLTKVGTNSDVPFYITWLDGSPDDFRNLRWPDLRLRAMEPTDTRCLAVVYTNGNWGLQNCENKMHFLCETRIIDPDAMLREPHMPPPLPEGRENPSALTP